MSAKIIQGALEKLYMENMLDVADYDQVLEDCCPVRVVAVRVSHYPENNFDKRREFVSHCR